MKAMDLLNNTKDSAERRMFIDKKENVKELSYWRMPSCGHKGF